MTGPGGRVLFIDDECDVRVAFQRALRRRAIHVDTAAGAADAVELVRTHDYELIATDYLMPDIDGLTLIDRLREIAPQASYMVVSGNCDLEVAAAAINQHGIASLITKPWSLNHLLEAVERCIEECRERARRKHMQAVAVEQSRALNEQKRALEDVLAHSDSLMTETLLNVLDLRTRETRAHCRRVAAYCQLLARELDLHGGVLVSLEHGALLHDVGKIGVPDAILCKPGALDPEEWAAMRQHCVMGAQLLEGFDNLAGARAVVLQHHERWDGTGYPGGLAGQAIRIEARILSVADTIDAILSNRRYRDGGTVPIVEREIHGGSGTQFDPAVVRAFCAIDAEAWLRVRDIYPDEGEATGAAQAGAPRRQQCHRNRHQSGVQ